MLIAASLLGSAAADSTAIATSLGTVIDSFLPGIDPKAKALILAGGVSALFHLLEKGTTAVLNGGYKSKFTENWSQYSAFINPVLVTVLGWVVGRFFGASPIVSTMVGMAGAGIRAAALKLTTSSKPTAPGGTGASPAVTAVALLGLLTLPSFDFAKLHYDLGVALHSERFTQANEYNTRYTIGAHYALTDHIVPKVQYFKPFGKNQHAGGELAVVATF